MTSGDGHHRNLVTVLKATPVQIIWESLLKEMSSFCGDEL